jgi:hypothetical protein
LVKSQGQCLTNATGGTCDENQGTHKNFRRCCGAKV